MHVFSFSVWNLKSKNPLTTFHPVSPMPWLCPSILLFRRHSHRMKMTLKRPFYVSTPALIILQILTIKKKKQKTYQSSAWRVSREMTFSIYSQLWATMHTWSLPRWVLESALLPWPSPQLSRSRMQPLPLICICPKPCSKKGDKLQATGNQTAKVLWTPIGQLLV